ncbi:MAG: SIR2 family protein, partial [Bacteroidota bacterium]
MSEPTPASQNWDLLISEIEKARCVLFIGPDLLSKPDGPSFQQRLRTHLEAKAGRSMPYYSEDEFFSFQKISQKRGTYKAIQEYYEREKPDELHELLAEIPLSLILSLSPDHLLAKAFEDKGFVYQDAYYKMGENPEALAKPYPDQPLLYNLLGSANDDQSLVFSYEDLFSYLEGMFGAYDLPDTLRDAIQEANHLIFLGIQYEKWYMKLLLRLLKLHQEKLVEACSQRGKVEGELKSFYEEHFDEINFIEVGAGNFIRELHKRCEAKGLLRKRDQNWQGNMLQQIQTAVAVSDTQDALNSLRVYAQRYQPEWLNELALLAGQHNALERDRRGNLI